MAPVTAMAPAAAATPAAAPAAAVPNLHGIAGHLALHARDGGRYGRGLSGQTEKHAGSNCNRKYVLLHNKSFPCSSFPRHPDYMGRAWKTLGLTKHVTLFYEVGGLTMRAGGGEPLAKTAPKGAVPSGLRSGLKAATSSRSPSGGGSSNGYGPNPSGDASGPSDAHASDAKLSRHFPSLDFRQARWGKSEQPGLTGQKARQMRLRSRAHTFS